MAGNANTVRQQVAGTIQLTLAPLSGSIITTTKTAFQLNNNAISLTGGGVIPITAGVTGLYAGTGQKLRLRGTGTIAGLTSGSTTVAFDLYEVPASVIAAGLTPTSFTNWNSLATFGGTAITATSLQASWSFEALVQLDAAGDLTGTFTGSVDGQAYASGSQAWEVMTAVTGLVGEADLNFAVAATIGGTEAGVIVTMNEFAIDIA